ncbi:MAG: pyruvate kinase, partial [Melioribacteraceae bacterium]|nr:pyruvate kinase [Melioribacteraceae bacterium]
MLFKEDNLKEIGQHLDTILSKVLDYENRYQHYIENVHPKYEKSAKNLIHYLAFRTFDNAVIQNKLHKLGFPSSTSSESNILHNLVTYKTIVKSLLNQNYDPPEELPVNKKESNALLKLNAEALFGKSDNGRYSKIMVTQPTIASEDKDFVNSLINSGMDCARINCAHDNEVIWKNIINNIKEISEECKIMMDLGGPKLRTGKMKPGPKVIHIKPKRNLLGQVTAPSKVWMAPYGVLPQSNVEY